MRYSVKTQISYDEFRIAFTERRIGLMNAELTSECRMAKECRIANDECRVNFAECNVVA